eukprot:TRINITY_DN10482_c0_g1_i1.p1 TRINITY_DN10482_c0_g1~~TRINITY_DN10482_c0_g1_i1.p1  ORF type:complete len:406 (-),score=73.31 TRINITY_DN10482_c0_g1_i1:41-1258(-)
MTRRPPRSTLSSSSAASDVYKRQVPEARGLGVVVLHPGSLDLRIGMAWDKKPKTIKHCVARRVPEKRAPPTHTPQSLIAGTWALEDPLREHELLVVETRLKEERDRAKDIHSRPSKKARMLQTVSALKKPSTTEMRSPPFPEPPGHTWTDTTAQPQHVFGEEGLFISPEQPYEVVWPIQRGHFNPRLGVATVCNMLDLIWTNAIQTKLALAPKDFGQYAVALVVRDTINRKEVAEMVHVLLRRMRFRSIFVIQESVAAGYGTGIATGCIVDLGHQTTSVCCVEDGYSLPNTRLEMPSGGDDISHTLQWLLRRVGASEFFAEGGAAGEDGPVDIGGDMRNYQDAVMYHRMKEDLCELMYINVAGQQQKGQYETRIIRQPSPKDKPCLLYTSPSPRDRTRSRMPSSA